MVAYSLDASPRPTHSQERRDGRMSPLGDSFPGNESFTDEGAIPDDVREAVLVAIRTVGEDGALGVVARAILAERERCARIADKNDMSAWGIAAAIRNGGA
jgi:hypothetical protein